MKINVVDHNGLWSEVEVPDDILEAERKIVEYAASHHWGIHWELGGICARTWANNCRGLKSILEQAISDADSANAALRDEQSHPGQDPRMR